ncbi:MAG: 50S ribosomal protein L22, partial [Candidatus Andersenbacteria bacterium]
TGMTAEKATHQLAFAVGKAPEILSHVLKSAIANAVNTHELSKDSLKISSILVNQGLVMKRFNPVAKGMAHSILKRTAHVTVTVEGDAVKKTEKKTTKKEVIETISANEFAELEKGEKQAEEQELTSEHTHKHESQITPDIKKTNQKGEEKTHRRKSIG